MVAFTRPLLHPQGSLDFILNLRFGALQDELGLGLETIEDVDSPILVVEFLENLRNLVVAELVQIETDELHLSLHNILRTPFHSSAQG